MARCSFIIYRLLSTVAVRVRRSRGERTWVWIIAACSLAHVGQSWSKASWSSFARASTVA